MSVLQFTRTVNTMELARVTELDPMRRWSVLNDNATVPSMVIWYQEGDNLWCSTHESFDNCTCTARVRLSGTLTDKAS